MEWKYATPLQSKDVFQQFEQRYHVSVPTPLRELVEMHNGAYPWPPTYVVDGDVHEVKALLSWNEEEDENVWDAMRHMQYEQLHNVLPFMNDNFGNWIALQFDPLEDEAAVVWIEAEEKHTIEPIAPSWEAFWASFQTT